MLTAFLAAFGRAIAEVGAIMIVGGNIRGYTRTMTTTIALDTSRGDLNLALAHCTRLLILDRGSLAADFASEEAAANAEWLPLLSPRLRMAQTPEGRPWVLYR